jgi:hypothetical protein
MTFFFPLDMYIIYIILKKVYTSFEVIYILCHTYSLYDKPLQGMKFNLGKITPMDSAIFDFNILFQWVFACL